MKSIVILSLIAILASASVADRYREFRAYAFEYGKKYETKAV